jgi:uncharacterized protein YjbJ (UPF0337 family)
VVLTTLAACVRRLRSIARAGITLARNTIEESHMNWDRIAGNWKQAKGKMKEQWGKLTDDDFDNIDGKREQLVGKIQNAYGIGKDEAEKQISDWEARQRDADETH